MFSKIRSLLSMMCFTATLCLSTAAPAANVGDIKMDDRVTVDGVSLQLNGAGIRYKGLFKISAIGLYSSNHFSSLDELIAMPGPKRLMLTMLREVDAHAFGKVMTRSMEDNIERNERYRLVSGLMRMSDIFSGIKVMRQGDVVFLDWIPGSGLVVIVNGKAQGEPLKEAEFYKALLSIWLGPIPVDFKLKDALLGIKS